MSWTVTSARSSEFRRRLSSAVSILIKCINSFNHRLNLGSVHGCGWRWNCRFLHVDDTTFSVCLNGLWETALLFWSVLWWTLNVGRLSSVTYKCSVQMTDTWVVYYVFFIFSYSSLSFCYNNLIPSNICVPGYIMLNRVPWIFSLIKIKNLGATICCSLKRKNFV